MGSASGGIEGVNRGRVRWLRGIGLVAALAAVFLLVAAIGAGEAQRGTRVLAVFGPVVAWIGSSGRELIMSALVHQADLGWVIGVAATALALVGVIIGGWRGVPLLLLAAAVSLTVWGQIELLSDRIMAGIYLYGAGFTCAALLGAWYPLTRLSGFPRWPLPGERPAATERRAWPAWELLLVFGLTVLALLLRVYALSELPNGFDPEMTVSMLSSRTLAGMRHYLPWGLITNSTGVAHLLPQMAFFHLFGTSIYALRLAAVLYGVTAVPLCYWLARRIAGTVPAVVAAVLLITAPEQLFWSRIEDTHFAPIAVAALVTAHLGLWLTERVSAVAVLAAALWMPFCRFFYAPAMLLFTYPLVLYTHAAIFVRRAWRKAWYAVPLLAGGLALWVLSLSIVFASFANWQWRLVNPTGAFGASAWTMGSVPGSSVPEVLWQHAQAAARNFGTVATTMTFHTGFSHWYVRADESRHSTLINVGVVVMAVLGLGYLLGQLYERRAFALLFWVGLGLLPAVLSDDPADRRMSIMFPALYIVVGVLVGAIVRLVRLCAGRVLEGVAGALLAVAVLGVAWSSMASHFLLRMTPLPVDEALRFTRPLFQESDVIFQNLDPTFAMLLVFLNLEDFLNRPPCYQAVAPTDLLGTALNPHCDFKAPVYEYTLPPERIAALRAQPQGGRITFLMNGREDTRPQIELLRALYPNAPFHAFSSHNQELELAALTISVADANALHRPELLLGPDQPAAAELASRALVGVTLAPSPESAAAGLVINGGLLIERPGWYRFALSPTCAQARLTVDAEESSELRPLLAGVHPFALALGDAAGCPLPLQLLMQSHAQPQLAPIPVEAIVSPAVAAVPAVEPPPLATYDGYGEARAFVEPAGRILDFGVDAAGTVFVLTQQSDVYRVHRFSPSGAEEVSWDPHGAQGYYVSAMAVAPDGRVLLRGERNMWTFDRDGHALSKWDDPLIGTPEIAVLDDGRSLSRRPDTALIAVLDRDGQLESQWYPFQGISGQFRHPVSVTRNQQGDLLVIDYEGRAALFHSPPGQFKPQFVRSFHIAFSEVSVSPRGVAFDGNARILLPDPDVGRTLVYSLEGQHLMAALPERDLDTRGFGHVVRYQATAERVYVLDEQRRLWVIAR